MRDGKTDFFGSVDRGQQRPRLVVGWAGGHRRAAMVGCLQEKATNRAPCFAWSAFAVGAANSGNAFLQIATLEKGCHRLLHNAAPVANLGLKAFVVDVLEGLKVLIDQAPQIRRLRIAWTVERRCLSCAYAKISSRCSRWDDIPRQAVVGTGQRTPDRWRTGCDTARRQPRPTLRQSRSGSEDGIGTWPRIDDAETRSTTENTTATRINEPVPIVFGTTFC